jgi:hypothetical protein
MRCIAKPLVLISLFTGTPTLADVAFEKAQRIVLFSHADGLLVRTTCPRDTLPVSVGTCKDEHAETALARVHLLAAPEFGGKAKDHAERARLWSVEIERADEKILELLNFSTDQTPDLTQLRADIDRLGSELSDLDNQSYALADQIALLEADLARRPDNDLLALLTARRGEKRAIDDKRRQLAAQMEDLRDRILQAQGGIFDQITFQRVVQQRTEALREYDSYLNLIAGEEDRRRGYERTLSYISDNGFTYKMFTDDSANRLGIEVANALYRAFDEAVAGSLELRIERSQPQYVSCPGGFDAFCGIRTKFVVPVTSRLKEVSCRIVGAVTPCYRLLMYKAEANQLIAVPDSEVSEESPEIHWTHANTRAQAWNLEAKGPWIVIGRCEHPGNSDVSLHYPGRIECSVKLRGP